MHIISAEYSELLVGFTHHFHDCHQIIYVAEGEISAFVNENEYLAREGSLLILSRFEQHSIRVLSPTYKRFRLLIANESSPSVHDNFLLSSVLTNHGDGFSHVIRLDEHRQVFEILLKNMSSEYSGKSPMYGEMLDLMLRQFLIELHRYHSELFLLRDSHSSMIVHEIQHRFEQNFHESFSLAELAADYHISQPYLSHLFKRITGCAPMEYLQACRLSVAKRYLVTTELSIKEIISRCGFSDESNFSRLFKAKNGVTPTEFRLANRISSFIQSEHSSRQMQTRIF